MGTPLTLVRDARVRYERFHEDGFEVQLRGRIMDAWQRSNSVRFLSLRDITETIQVLVQRASVSEETWTSFQSAENGDAVIIRGIVGLSSRGLLSLFPVAPVESAPGLEHDELLTDDISGVGTQVMLARIESQVRAYLSECGFVEMSARYLSSSWGEEGLQPLRVQFAGQSTVPLYLAVSPLPKLLTAALAMGQSEFFTIGRSFATNFIATQNGAESVLVGAVSVDRTLDECCDLELSLIGELLGSAETAVDFQILNDVKLQFTESEGPTLEAPDAPEGLHVHRTRDGFLGQGPGGFPVASAYQISWHNEVFLAEGFALTLSRSLQVNFMVMYVERFLRLLRTQDNRRIRDLLTLGGASHSHDRASRMEGANVG